MKNFYQRRIAELEKALELTKQHQALFNQIIELQPELAETLEELRPIQVTTEDCFYDKIYWHYLDKFGWDADQTDIMASQEQREIVNYILETIVIEQMMPIVSQLEDLDMPL